MLKLIIAALLSAGFNVNGSHFTMNNNNAENIRRSELFIQQGGEGELLKYVSIDDKTPDDIVIIDDVDPAEIR